ncbi:agmatine deiminase [Caulobacter sp. SLTY]|uniref:agmatine deiminase family protein n=1 Tax=Caulobacter sp. SLTY TaxID=2683262 RepID=UPI0014136A2A|nr:agmatine deiminase family protein [Caulobacter sp. SLTY]NBB16736.1 agmatine deiminase [Caulobacter sp. SLTY]NBB16764.1 agmatine deiminase [Caulobacter sp. SLTY]
MSTTPVIPAEWSPHRAMWLGYPSHGELWEEDLEPAREEVAALAAAMAGPGAERVRLMVCGDEAEASAWARLGEVSGIEIVRGQFGDIWLRDTGPIFSGDGRALGFRFNGWGGKYQLDGDDTVADQLAAAAGAPLVRNDFVLEGGALDHDGHGTVLTTRQCLTNPNRNPGWGEAEAEAALTAALGAKKVLWLGDGLRRDHTDGHVDNLARFVAPGVVACPIAWGKRDPNADLYDETAGLLRAMTDSRGQKLQVMRIPSPGWTVDAEGEMVPASHMNFIVANQAVIMPTYDDEKAASFAIDALASLFPERKVIGLPSKAILTGGGSFHCITQQEPV